MGPLRNYLDLSGNGNCRKIERTFETGTRLDPSWFFAASSLRFSHKVSLNVLAKTDDAALRT